MEGISQSKILDEVGVAIMLKQARNSLLSERAYLSLKPLHVRGHEPSLREDAVFSMIGAIHLDQRSP